MEQSMVGEQRVDHVGRATDLRQLPHPLQVGGALGVKVPLGAAAQNQRQGDLGEQHRLEVRLGLHRLDQPRFHLRHPLLGDGVAFAVRPGAWLGRPGHDLAVTSQAGQRGVHLPERKWPPAPEVGVVLPLQVVAVTRLTLKQPQQRHRHNTHH